MHRLLILLGALLAPALAGAQAPDYEDDFNAHRFWLGVGLGYGSVSSHTSAPAADRKAVAAGLEVGHRITPQLGMGVELGVVGATSGCDGLGCSALQTGFAPNFTRWFLLGEYRPGNSGMRVGLGAGKTWMCYRYYETDESSWERFFGALLGNDDDGSPGRSTACKHLGAFGASVSIGYQWALRAKNEPVSLGLRLRGETAKFAASSKAHTQEFRHRALVLQLQVTMN